MAIGDRIKARREELGITQQQLADRVGFKSKSTINKIELGINGVAQKRIVDFAKALDTSIEYLMEMDDVKNIKQHRYYLDGEAAEEAQALFDDPDLHALLKAGRASQRKNVRMVTELLLQMKGTNPDG